MEIDTFIAGQGSTILNDFQQLDFLNRASFRLDRKVSNPVGMIYDCALFANGNSWAEQADVSFRILYERDLERISLDVVDVPNRSSLANYLKLLNLFEALQNRLNREFARVKDD